MKIGLKLILGFLAVSFLFGVLGYILTVQLEKISEPLSTEIPESIGERTKAERMDHLAEFMRYYDEFLTQSARNYVFTEDKRWKKRYIDAEPKLGEIIKEAVQKGDEKDREFFSSVDAANRALVEMEHKSIELVSEGKPEEAIKILESDVYRDQKETYESGLRGYVQRKGAKYDELLSTSTKAVDSAVKKTRALVKTTIQITLFFVIISLIASISVGFLISRLISIPIIKLRDVSEKIGKGDLDYKVEVKTGDEIEQLADSFNKMTSDLKKTTTSIDKLNKEIAERKRVEKDKEKLLHDLDKRMKELRCLYGLSKLVERPGTTVEEIFEELVQTIPTALQHPDHACARIIYENKEFKTNNFEESSWKHSAKIEVYGEKKGVVEARYLKDVSQTDKGPFLEEEKELIGALAERMGNIIESKQSEKILKETKDELEVQAWGLKQALERLRKLYDEVKKVNQFNETLVSTIPFGMDIVDEEGNILFMNETFKNVFGNEAVGRTCWEIYREDKKQCINCPLKEGIKIGETKTIEVEGVVGGGIFQISHTGMFYKDKPAVLELFEDITVKKRAAQELVKTMNVRSGFISMVSHELRTPLTAIKEGIGIVLDGVAGDINDEQKDFLQLGKRNVDRLARLINDVLNFQKLDAGRMQFKMEENDINEVAKEIEGMMAPVAKEEGLKLLVEIGEDIPKAKFDKDRIMQVFANLVSNAIKFTRTGHIKIVTTNLKGLVHVMVEDTGVGIKEEDIPKLFQSFEQFGEERARRSGTGLGLAISKQIIIRHGGKIWAESAVGKGTTFHFILHGEKH